MGHRKQRLDRRLTDAAEQKLVNARKKNKERVRRDARMLDVVKSGSLPYTPDIMSWLSRQLDKPAGKVTAEDVASLTC